MNVRGPKTASLGELVMVTDSLLAELAKTPGIVDLDTSFEKGKPQDLSGNNNHGKLSGVKPAEGKVGQAMQFPGRGATSVRRHFVEYQWSVESPPVVARAIVLADKTLFFDEAFKTSNKYGPATWRRFTRGSSVCVVFLQAWPSVQNGPITRTLEGYYCAESGGRLALGQAEQVIQSVRIILPPPAEKQSS